MKVDSRFYCFGCGASGDVIDFAALLHGLGTVSYTHLDNLHQPDSQQDESDGGTPYIKTVYGMGCQWTGGEAK